VGRGAQNGDTPMARAKTNGHDAVVKLLQERGQGM
jgi:hypothetical protein